MKKTLIFSIPYIHFDESLEISSTASFTVSNMSLLHLVQADSKEQQGTVLLGVRQRYVG